MDKDQDKIAGGNGGLATACGPSPGPGCSQLMKPKDTYELLFSSQNLGMQLQKEFEPVDDGDCLWCAGCGWYGMRIECGDDELCRICKREID